MSELKNSCWCWAELSSGLIWSDKNADEMRRQLGSWPLDTNIRINNKTLNKTISTRDSSHSDDNTDQENNGDDDQDVDDDDVGHWWESLL